MAKKLTRVICIRQHDRNLRSLVSSSSNTYIEQRSSG